MGTHRVIVTQPSETGRLAALLQEHGVDVYEVPTIRIQTIEKWYDNIELQDGIKSYDWIVYTSVNTVSIVCAHLSHHRNESDAPRVAAVGTGTAHALREHGWNVDFVPSEFNGATMAKELSEFTELDGQRVFFPKGEIARTELPTGLRAAGAHVTEVVVYRTLPVMFDAVAVREALHTGDVGIVTFTSPSTVMYFASGLGVTELSDVLALPVRVVSIGPTTSAALRERGRAPDRESKEATMESLVDAVRDELKGMQS